MWLLVTSFCVLVGSSAYAQAKDKLNIILGPDYPPYYYKDGATYKGMDIEKLAEIFKRMKQDYTISDVPWLRALNMIKEGRADILVNVLKKPEREVFADFPKESFAEEIQVLFTRKDLGIKYDGDLSTLAKYKFGVMNGYSYGTAFDDAVKTGTLKVEEVNSNIANFKKLASKRIDLVCENVFVGTYYLKQMNAADQMVVLKPPVGVTASYLAFSKKKNLKEVLEKSDQILADMKKDGTYDKIVAKYSK